MPARQREGTDLSLGAVADLQAATSIARELVEVHGMGDAEIGQARYRSDSEEGGRHPHLSPATLEALDRQVRDILEEGRERAAKIVRDNQAMVETLRDLLIEKKVIDARTLTELNGEKGEKGGKRKKAIV